MRPWVSRHWRAARALSVSSETASTKPSPKRLSDMRSVRIVSVVGTRSWISSAGNAALGQMARSLIRLRPVITRRSVPDRDARVDEAARGVAVSRSQLGHLAGAAGVRVLVALAAGLRVVERAEPVGDPLDAVELLAVGFVGVLVHEAVAGAVERGGRLLRAAADGAADGQAQDERQDQVLHRNLRREGLLLLIGGASGPCQGNPRERAAPARCSIRKACAKRARTS